MVLRTATALQDQPDIERFVDMLTREATDRRQPCRARDEGKDCGNEAKWRATGICSGHGPLKSYLCHWHAFHGNVALCDARAWTCRRDGGFVQILDLTRL
jgi:hypothetical protein